jgi:uncharacterized protein
VYTAGSQHLILAQLYNAYVIAGGSGFIGTALGEHLVKAGQKVYILTRSNLQSKHALLHYITWNPTNGFIQQKIVEDNVCLINLAGANVAGERWSAKRKQEIVQSRTVSAQALYKLCADRSIKASLYIGASAIGYYGSPGVPCVEDMDNSSDYLGETCRQWEDASLHLKRLGLTVCIMRIGLVMGNEGGALPELKTSLSFRVAGVPGSGKQIYSWIHLTDVVKAISFAADHKLDGPYNCVAPQPASAKQVIVAMAKATNKWYITLHMPKFILDIALGEFAIELTKSVHVSSTKLQSLGFTYNYPSIEGCMQNLMQAQ